MSYARIIDDGFYVYPTDEGIQFDFVPMRGVERTFIPDVFLDLLLSKMRKEELEDRIKHGKELSKAIKNERYGEAYNKRNFFDWREQRCSKQNQKD